MSGEVARLEHHGKPCPSILQRFHELRMKVSITPMRGVVSVGGITENFRAPYSKVQFGVPVRYL